MASGATPLDPQTQSRGPRGVLQVSKQNLFYHSPSSFSPPATSILKPNSLSHVPRHKSPLPPPWLATQHQRTPAAAPSAPSFLLGQLACSLAGDLGRTLAASLEVDDILVGSRTGRVSSSYNLFFPSLSWRCGAESTTCFRNITFLRGILAFYDDLQRRSLEPPNVACASRKTGL